MSKNQFSCPSLQTTFFPYSRNHAVLPRMALNSWAQMILPYPLSTLAAICRYSSQVTPAHSDFLPINCGGKQVLLDSQLEYSP
jgi:hypothetical protein